MEKTQIRKIIIGLISFGVVIGLFWGYTMITDSVPIITPDQADQDELQMPGSTENIQQVGDTKIIGSERARYTVLDPETKETRQIFGFEKLLNPGKETSRRKVTKPYIVFYESTYQCRVDSDEGTFQMEMAGSDPTPKDAQLKGNVIIHLTPKAGSKISETSIYLDDLIFSGERSEFATEGPVKIISEKMTLNGHGLNLIFDTEKGRVDFMHIHDLETLHIKNGLASEYTGVSKTPTTTESTNPVKPVAEQKTDNKTASSDYYQCTLEENVRIEYGSELIVSGAQRVNIQNILFSEKRPKSASSSLALESMAPKKQPVLSPLAEKSETKDVFVRCDGGIILRPMQRPVQNKTDSTMTDLSVEMSGTPLRIDRVAGANDGTTEPLVYCGLLEYRPQQDILRLFTDAQQPQIVLEAQRSRSRIQTRGNVFWDRKNQYANIAGPGTIYLSGSDPTLDPSEIAFDGMMDLLFAEPPGRISEPVIRSINFSGGINGILKENGGYMTQADSARLDFGFENAISKACLLGGVLLESINAEKFQQAVADSATFHFEENKVKTADLAGGASFRSNKGNLHSTNIEIEFETDKSGSQQPVSIKAVGDSILETSGQQSKQQPAKFEAKRINYDLQSGSGVAYGPIRFTFYQRSDQAKTPNESRVPIVVTADENAEFVADASRSINKVIFNRNVLVTRKNKISEYEQIDTLRGEKLTVYLNNEQPEQSNVQRITMTEGKVAAESKRAKDGQQLFRSKVFCSSMTFDQVNNEILIQGPGKMEILNTPLETSEQSLQAGLRGSFAAKFAGFRSISWHLNDHKILTQEDRNAMEISYFPLSNGVVQKENYLYTRQLEARYNSDSTVLTYIFADSGVIYEQYNPGRSQRLHDVNGQTLTYNAKADERWLTIRGSNEKPCFADGWRTEQAYIDLNSGEVKTSLSTMPGVIRGF